ncbi:MAG: XRE family transcriptional regulator [Rikenellaceae bacterium]
MSDSTGNKIQKMRTDAGLSVAELAAQALITVSQLEKIEDQTLNPSISVMIRIARILGTRLGTLLDGIESGEPVICTPTNHTPSVRVTNPENAELGNLDFYSLAQQKSDRNMEPFIVNVGYTEKSKRETSYHEGEEFIYILSGSVELTYGSKSYTLNQGSSMYYDSIVPHNLSAALADTTAQILAVTYTPY